MSDTGRKVFVGGLDYNLTSDDVRLYFSKYGGIEDAVVLTNDRNGPFPGRSRGFGFITFNDEPSAQKVLDAAPHTLGEKTVEVKLAIPKDQLGAPSRRERGPSDGPVSDEKTSKLFVGGIRNDMTSEELMSVFQEEGAVSVDIMKDRSNGKGRGFGFVVFDNEEVVDRLAKQRMRQIGDKQVEMKKAQSVGRMRETERRDGGGGRFDDYGSRGGGGGGGPMRNNRGGFRGDRGGPGGGYRDNRGGGGGYNGGMGPGGGMPYNNSPQGWGNNLMSSMNQNFNPGFNGQMSAGGYGGMGGTAPAYNGGQNPSGGYNTNYGNYGTSSNGNYGGQNTAYPGSYGNQTYGQGQGQGQGQSQGQQADPSTAFHQLQQAVQNFVATTNQPPGSEAYPGYPQASQSNHSDNSYSGYGDQSATPPVSQRTKQAAPYYR